MKEMNETIQRSDCFKLLAACFYEPEKALFLEENLGENIGLLLGTHVPEGAVAARHMQKDLEGVTQEKMSIDHAALFVGPFELLAAPYGSVYMEKKRRVMGDSTMSAAQFYQEADLSLDIKEPPDHIVVELEFMYYLSNREASATRDGQFDEVNRFKNMQARFYHQAMKPWVGKFCDAIRAGTDNGFYVHLAKCLACFLNFCEDIYSNAVAIQQHPTCTRSA